MRRQNAIGDTYIRLLKLYKKNKDSGKTPLEDYTTEIIVGLLKSNNYMLDDFVNDILEISGDSFRIESQRKFYLKNDIDCIVDIVIENEDIICFLENKVNSTEGNRQLERYGKVLDSIFKEEKKNIYLRYCTKYYDKKNINNIDFKQFRWMDVYRFLKKYEECEIVKEILEFMRSEEMSSAGEFDFQDMIVLSNINYTFSKINECFDNVRVIFKEILGISKQTSTIRQINESNGFWLWMESVFGKGYSEIYVGFSISENEGKVIPRLMVGIKCKKNNDKFNKFNEIINREDSIFDYKYLGDDASNAWFEESISKFLSSKNQLDEIQEWFCERIEEINDFRKNSSELDWDY